MTIPIILILAVLWAAFFLWPLVQRRLSGGGRNSIGSFSKRVGVVGRVGGHLPTRSLSPLSMPELPAPPAAFGAAAGKAEGLPMSPMAQRRRRDALVLLGGAVIATLLLAVVSGSMVAWAVQLLATAAFVAYVVALVHIRRRAEERRAKVHFLPQPTHTPSLVLRRTVSS